MIVGSGEMQCNASVGAGLRGMGLGRNQNYLRLVVEFQAKDGRFRVVFSELLRLPRLQVPISRPIYGHAPGADAFVRFVSVESFRTSSPPNCAQ